MILSKEMYTSLSYIFQLCPFEISGYLCVLSGWVMAGHCALGLGKGAGAGFGAGAASLYPARAPASSPQAQTQPPLLQFATILKLNGKHCFPQLVKFLMILRPHKLP